MRAPRVHHHPCAHCGAQTACDGEREQNYDGWPEVICLVFHPAPHVFCCEACAEASTTAIEDED